MSIHYPPGPLDAWDSHRGWLLCGCPAAFGEGGAIGPTFQLVVGWVLGEVAAAEIGYTIQTVNSPMCDEYMSTPGNTAKPRAIYAATYRLHKVARPWLGANLQCISQNIQCISQKIQCISQKIQCISQKIQCISQKIQCISQKNTMH